MLDSAQSRAGRALLSWSQAMLAEKAGVSLSTIHDFESGRRVPVRNNMAAIERALSDAGVMLLPAENGLGSGVRFSAVAVEK